jgi:hypothetical protein
MLQSIVGFFCDSKCTPEIVSEMLAHMGVTVSLATTRNMVKSLHKHANSQLRTLPLGNMVYNIFDMDFKVAQPVTSHQGTHVSVTAATFAPYIGASLQDLRFTKELHEISRYNKDLHPTNQRIYKPTFLDVLPHETPQSGQGLNSLSKAFAWHMQAILVEREPVFAKYCLDLGLPEVIDVLPVQKTMQFPENAINADESQNDGNWEVLKSLLDQVSKFAQVSFPNLHIN